MLTVFGSSNDIDLGNNTIIANSFSAIAPAGITGGTITAATISLTATNGSIGAANNRIRVRSTNPTTFIATTATPEGFLARANSTSGSVYLSTNNNDWLTFITAEGENRITGSTPLNDDPIILEPPVVEPVVAAVKKKEPGGLLSSALDPILDLFGSGCEKDDILATVISGFGILCGEE